MDRHATLRFIVRVFRLLAVAVLAIGVIGLVAAWQRHGSFALFPGPLIGTVIQAAALWVAAELIVVVLDIDATTREILRTIKGDQRE